MVPSLKTRRSLLGSITVTALAILPFTRAASAALTENGKTWGLSKRPHFDRVLAAWAIKRFIDTQAHFMFAAKIEDLAPNVMPVGFPTGELSAFEPAGGTCFHKAVVKYQLDDPALLALDRMDSQAIVWNRTMLQGGTWTGRTLPVDMEDRYARWSFGLLGLADAFQRKARSDQECLDLGFPIFDALYDLVAFELKAKGVKT